ncbi:MAG: hypothetical protein ACSHXL_04600 [Bacteroidota bacterium]
MCDFIGFKLKYPAQKKRLTDWKSHSKAEKVDAIYSELASQIDAMPSSQII